MEIILDVIKCSFCYELLESLYFYHVVATFAVKMFRIRPTIPFDVRDAELNTKFRQMDQ